MQQSITPRNGAHSTDRVGRAADQRQRPAKRGRSVVANRTSWRSYAAYLPMLGRLALLIAIGLALYSGYRVAAAASFFQLRTVDISGAARQPPEQVRALTQRFVGNAGVWNTNIDALRADLEKLPWVRSASVSRVLPDGLRIRIAEREPLALVHNAAGEFIWVDQDAVALGVIAIQQDKLPPFFIRGWNDLPTENARMENRERIHLYEQLLREWSSAGLTARVSEVNLKDTNHVIVYLAGNDAGITVHLVSNAPGADLKRGLDELDKCTSNANCPAVGMVFVYPGQVTLGPRMPRPTAPPAEGAPGAQRAERSTANVGPADVRTNRRTGAAVQANVRARSAPAGARSPDTHGQRLPGSDAVRKPVPPGPVRGGNGATRPRRVG